jgi:hypothetical protein
VFVTGIPHMRVGELLHMLLILLESWHDMPHAPLHAGLHCALWRCAVGPAAIVQQLGVTQQVCLILANILEQCSLFLPLRWGAGSMALMLWLNW